MTEIFQATEKIDVRRPASHIAASIARTFPDHIPLYICTVLFDAILFGILFIYGIAPDLRMGVTVVAGFFQFALIAVGLISLYELLRMYRAHENHAVLATLLRRMQERFSAGDRPGNIVHSLATLTPLMLAFTAFKNAIPYMNPFAWDAWLTQVDTHLGFGHAPWVLLQAVFGHPAITVLINIIYDGWFLVVLICTVWQGFSSQRSPVRLQFLLAYAIAWFAGGSLLALWFSSAGPCFYGHLNLGADPYAAQMAYLRGIGADWIWSLGVQDSLWQSFVRGGGAISGVSAMPSMHVTIAVLLALLGAATNRKQGLALGAFAFAIVIGSIHLAWHYAADGIAGIALALLFWWLAGHIARRWMARTAPQ